MSIKVIAFDLFGTVFDMSHAHREDVKDYVKHVRDPKWSPLQLPQYWNEFPAHPDSKEGIGLLRTKYTVVPLSNAPIGVQIKLSKKANIAWDGYIPLEMYKIYKPHAPAYWAVGDVLGVKMEEVMMVTANETFGDLEGSAAVGMTPKLIRILDCPTIPALWDELRATES